MEQPGTSSSSNVESDGDFDENFKQFVDMMKEIKMGPEEFLNILHDGVASHKKLKNTIESIKQVKKDIITILKMQRAEMKNINEIPHKTANLQEEAFVIKQEIKKLEPILKIQEDRKKELEQNKESNMLIQREKQFPLHVETNVMNKSQLKEKLEYNKDLIKQKENELVELTNSICNLNNNKKKLQVEKIKLQTAIRLKKGDLENIRKKRKELEKKAEQAVEERKEKEMEIKMQSNTSKSNSKYSESITPTTSYLSSSPVVLDIPQIRTRSRQRNESTSTSASTQSFATPEKKKEKKETGPQLRKRYKKC